MDVNLTDGQTHRVSLYFLDWDRGGRAERVDVIDPATGAVLDSRAVSAFSGGTYLSWDVSGHVAFRITRTAGPNAVLSGIFFGTPPAALQPGPSHGSHRHHGRPSRHQASIPPGADAYWPWGMAPPEDNQNHGRAGGLAR